MHLKILQQPQLRFSAFATQVTEELVWELFTQAGPVGESASLLLYLCFSPAAYSETNLSHSGMHMPPVALKRSNSVLEASNGRVS